MRQAVLFLFLLLAPALTQAAGGLRITEAWMRAPAAGQRVGALYLKIVNDGKADDTLQSADSPVAERTEIHSMIMENGVMKMRKLEHLPLPAGGIQIFSPSNIHLMLIDLKGSFKEGDTVPFTLRFEKAGDISATAFVRPIAE
jgi:copper(I)-binding protein